MKHLGLFAKFWTPGNVKTRLAASIGPGLACQIYESFLLRQLDQLSESGDHRHLVFTPTSKQGDFRAAVSPDWGLVPQVDGDLGYRMKRFFQWVFHNDAQAKVVLIGADCPQLTPELIDQAFEMLENQSTVLGPSLDGGYYLLGLSVLHEDLFSGIAWSTPTVFPQTIARLDARGEGYALLPKLRDVDELDDLQRLIDDAKTVPDQFDGTLKLQLQQIEYLLSKLHQ